MEVMPLLIDDLTIGPKYYDIFLTDFEEFPTTYRKLSIQNDVAKNLNVTYLSEADLLPTFPVSGIFMGGHHRNFVNLICTMANGKPINVIFFIATGNKQLHYKIKLFLFLPYYLNCDYKGSKYTYMSDATISALNRHRNINLDYDLSKEFDVNIHGLKAHVRRYVVFFEFLEIFRKVLLIKNNNIILFF